MLTTIISTPRTGSSTLFKSMNSELFIPDYNLNGQIYGEFFNVGCNKKIIPNLYKDFMKSVDELSDKNLIVKIIVWQLEKKMMDDILKKSDRIIHSVRRDYQKQLKSFIISKRTKVWGANELKTRMIAFNQEIVDNNHELLTEYLMKHEKIYRQWGGEVIYLEDRFDSLLEYPKTKIFGKIEWPTFDTENLFREK